jgi:hypothetical protein
MKVNRKENFESFFQKINIIKSDDDSFAIFDPNYFNKNKLD